MFDSTLRRSMAVILLLAVIIATLFAIPAFAAPGDSPQEPIVVSSPAEVPAGAVEDSVSTYDTPGACDTTRSWVSTKPGTSEVSHNEWTAEQRSRTFTPAVTEVKEYTYDKYVQRQKARWNGNTYIGPISANYPGSYTWRDAGFDPVVNTTGVAPTAPGPVRGEFIHNNGGTWYFTLFYEYRLIGTRVVRAAQPESYGPWSAWSAYGSNPYRTEPVLPANTSTREYRKSGPVKVIDSAATPTVVTYYAYSDNVVCETTTPTPTPVPPTVTPEPPKDKVKPRGGIDTRCTGTTTYKMDNSRSDVRVPFTLSGAKWSKTISVKPGRTQFFVHQFTKDTRAQIKASGLSKSIRVNVGCPKPPVNPPHGGVKVVA